MLGAQMKKPPGGGFFKREFVVGERGFEPPAPASRTQCSTRLSYSPTLFTFFAKPTNISVISLDCKVRQF